MLWAKNNRVVVALLIVGLVGAVGTFTASIKKTAGAAASEEVPAVQVQVRQAARRVDAFYARAIGEPVLDHRHPTRDEYEQMNSALQGLAITFNAQNQPEMAKTVELGLSMLKRLWTPGAVEPGDWQIERLQQQRAEWDTVFRTLGQPLSSAAGPETGASAP